MTSLVLAEHNNQQLQDNTRRTITAAQQLGDVVVLVAGFQCQSVAKQVATLTGVSKVLLADNAVYQYGLAENISRLMVTHAKGFSHLLAPASTFGKNIMPRVAALLNVAQISDIITIVDEATFVRPIYAGNAIATVKSNDQVKVITVRSSAFANAIESSAPVTIEAIDTIITNEQASFVNQQLSESKRPELTSARVIVSGGRGLQSGDNFKLLEGLADRLNAAIGASRAAVDAGFVPNDYQVGQTGKIVAPELYLAFGISGAIQHLAGMKESKVIVAVNKDEDAPIFKVADYGLVGDLFAIIPELNAELDKL